MTRLCICPGMDSRFAWQRLAEEKIHAVANALYSKCKELLGCLQFGGMSPPSDLGH